MQLMNSEKSLGLGIAPGYKGTDGEVEKEEGTNSRGYHSGTRLNSNATRHLGK